MKKIILSFCLWLSVIPAVMAQDIITFKDGSDIEAKVFEVSTTEIAYKKYNNPDGPLYHTPISEVFRIVYENGETEVFGNSYSSSQIMLNAAGEITEGMKYSDYKHLYNARMYVHQPGDPYSRFWAGLASFFIPGLGECIDEQWGRGLLVMGINIGLYVLARTDATVTQSDGVTSIQYGNFGSIVVLARTGFGIWSIYDAVHIAKIKNMYYQDLRSLQAGLDVKIEPYFAYTPAASGQFCTSNTLQPVAGLTMRVVF